MDRHCFCRISPQNTTLNLMVYSFTMTLLPVNTDRLFPSPPRLLSAAKAAKRAEINQCRDGQEDGNYLFEYDGHRWDYGKATQDRMSISLSMAKRNVLPSDFAWTDGGGDIVPMDNAGLIALAAAIEQAMFEKGIQINQRQLQMRAELEALTTLEAVKDYVPGWPEGN